MFKKLILIFFILMALLVACTNIDNEDLTMSEKKETEEKVNPEVFDETPAYKYLIHELYFGMPYNEVIAVLGEPNKILNIEDEILIIQKGYFMILEYDHLELVMYNSNYERKFDVSNSIILQVDIIKADENYLNIKVGDSIDAIKEQYDLKPYRINSEEAKSIYYFNLIRDYDNTGIEEVYFISGGVAGGLPVTAAILVDKNNIISRIIVGLPTAG